MAHLRLSDQEDGMRARQRGHTVVNSAVGGRLTMHLALLSLVVAAARASERSHLLTQHTRVEYHSQVDKLAASIVFVHAGADASSFPDYMATAIKQAVRWNPNAAVRVVVPQAVMTDATLFGRTFSQQFPENGVYWRSKVQVTCVEDLPVSQLRKSFMSATSLDSNFDAGFWKNTFERLFVLADAMQHWGIDEAFHLENDNMIYTDLSSHLSAFRSLYPGMACTNIGHGYVTAGLLYVHRLSALTDFLKFSLQDPAGTDMVALAKYADVTGEQGLGLLPVEPFQLNKTRNDMKLSNVLGGVFDGAAHGQYLGGADPKHHPHRAGFINSHSGIHGYKYTWATDGASGLRRVYLSTTMPEFAGKSVPLLLVHVHCKQLSFFES